jgi:hypothetical protein
VSKNEEYPHCIISGQWGVVKRTDGHVGVGGSCVVICVNEYVRLCACVRLAFVAGFAAVTVSMVLADLDQGVLCHLWLHRKVCCLGCVCAIAVASESLPINTLKATLKANLKV